MQRNIIINKGSAQVTLPKAFAETLGLQKGCKVDVKMEEGGKIVITRAVINRIQKDL